MGLWRDFQTSGGRVGDLRDWSGEMYPGTPPSMLIDTSHAFKAFMETNKGILVFRLFAKSAPITVNNFVFLIREGFYNGLWFHRIIQDFLIQSGDPSGSGYGGTGYTFENEPIALEYTRGKLAMANARANTNSSQFFILHRDTPSLPKQYPIFGELIEGFDVLDDLAQTPVASNSFGEISRPTEVALIKKISVEETV